MKTLIAMTLAASTLFLSACGTAVEVPQTAAVDRTKVEQAAQSTAVAGIVTELSIRGWTVAPWSVATTEMVEGQSIVSLPAQKLDNTGTSIATLRIVYVPPQNLGEEPEALVKPADPASAGILREGMASQPSTEEEAMLSLPDNIYTQAVCGGSERSCSYVSKTGHSVGCIGFPNVTGAYRIWTVRRGHTSSVGCYVDRCSNISKCYCPGGCDTKVSTMPECGRC